MSNCGKNLLYKRTYENYEKLAKWLWFFPVYITTKFYVLLGEIRGAIIRSEQILRSINPPLFPSFLPSSPLSPWANNNLAFSYAFFEYTCVSLHK